MFHRIDKLLIDNKMATEEYLQGLLEHIKFHQSDGGVGLKCLEIVKVFFTERKAKLFADILADPKC